MKRYRLIIAPIVRDQISQQVLFIAHDSIVNALAWEGRLRRAVSALVDFSGYAKDEDATDRLGFVVHKFVFERNYLVHFRVDKSAAIVYVLNFRHGARLPKSGEP